MQRQRLQSKSTAQIEAVNFIIYDLEATCWRGRPPHGANEIIEIGAYKLNQYGETLGKFSRFVKPSVNPQLSYFCTKLTTITQDQVDAAATFPRVIEDFKDWIGLYDDYLLSAWGDFDIQMIRNDCNLHNLEQDWLEHYTNLKGQYHRIKNMNKYTGLKRTLIREGFEFTGVQHRAISDADNLCKIFVKYIDEWRY